MLNEYWGRPKRLHRGISIYSFCRYTRSRSKHMWFVKWFSYSFGMCILIFTDLFYIGTLFSIMIKSLVHGLSNVDSTSDVYSSAKCRWALVFPQWHNINCLKRNYLSMSSCNTLHVMKMGNKKVTLHKIRTAYVLMKFMMLCGAQSNCTTVYQQTRFVLFSFLCFFIFQTKDSSFVVQLVLLLRCRIDI